MTRTRQCPEIAADQPVLVENDPETLPSTRPELLSNHEAGFRWQGTRPAARARAQGLVTNTWYPLSLIVMLASRLSPILCFYSTDSPDLWAHSV